MRNFIKRTISLMLAAVMLILSLLLGGCSVFQQGFDNGFYDTSILPRELQNLQAACVGEKRVFDINDVTLDFYYGFFSEGPEYWTQRTVTLSFVNYCGDHFNEEKYIKKEIRKMDGSVFFTDKYKVATEYSFLGTTKFNYNHCETITVPQELFYGEKGYILFQITFDFFNVETNYMHQDSGATRFFYKVDGDKVILSDKEFWF